MSLSNYFRTVGGELEIGHLIFPTDKITYNYENGDLCSNGRIGNLKLYINGKKFEDYENYLIYPNSNVPPGDCIIIEFSPGNSETTDKICESWLVKGWNYDNFKRREVKIGGKTWR